MRKLRSSGNNALMLGVENELGRVKQGWKADLILVNGNPQANFKLLYPTGTDAYEDGEYKWGGTVECTIKDGWVYKGSILMEDTLRIVEEARASGSGGQ